MSSKTTPSQSTSQPPAQNPPTSQSNTQKYAPPDDYQRERLRQLAATRQQNQPNWLTRKWRSYKALVASGPSSSDVDRSPGGVAGQLGRDVMIGEMGDGAGAADGKGKGSIVGGVGK
jgi:hypothetical protein